MCNSRQTGQRTFAKLHMHSSVCQGLRVRLVVSALPAPWPWVCPPLRPRCQSPAIENVGCHARVLGYFCRAAREGYSLQRLASIGIRAVRTLLLYPFQYDLYLSVAQRLHPSECCCAPIHFPLYSGSGKTGAFLRSGSARRSQVS
jgi:hypothetical protein